MGFFNLSTRFLFAHKWFFIPSMGFFNSRKEGFYFGASDFDSSVEFLILSKGFLIPNTLGMKDLKFWLEIECESTCVFLIFEFL